MLKSTLMKFLSSINLVCVWKKFQIFDLQLLNLVTDKCQNRLSITTVRADVLDATAS